MKKLVGASLFGVSVAIIGFVAFSTHIGSENNSIRTECSGYSNDFDARIRPTSDEVFEYIEGELERVMSRAEDNDLERGRYYAWGPTYLLEGALAAYEATEEARFLRLAVAPMMTMAENRDSATGIADNYRGRVLEAWGSDHFGDGEVYTSVVTHAGRIAAPMARFAWIVNSDEELAESYGNAAERLLVVAEEALLEYDDEFRTADDGRIGYYWRTIADRIEPLNHQTSVGEALLYVAATTDDPFWDMRANQLAEFVRDSLYEQSNGTIAWNYAPEVGDLHAGRVEPVWKAHVTIRFMHHAARLGVVFSDDDLEEVARSLRINVLRDGDTINAYISEEVDPMSNYENRYGGYTNVTPLYILSHYDRQLGEAIECLISERPEFGGWSAHPKTATAYVERLENRR